MCDRYLVCWPKVSWAHSEEKGDVQALSENWERIGAEQKLSLPSEYFGKLVMRSGILLRLYFIKLLIHVWTNSNRFNLCISLLFYFIEIGCLLSHSNISLCTWVYLTNAVIFPIYIVIIVTLYIVIPDDSPKSRLCWWITLTIIPMLCPSNVHTLKRIKDRLKRLQVTHNNQNLLQIFSLNKKISHDPCGVSCFRPRDLR